MSLKIPLHFWKKTGNSVRQKKYWTLCPRMSLWASFRLRRSSLIMVLHLTRSGTLPHSISEWKHLLTATAQSERISSPKALPAHSLTFDQAMCLLVRSVGCETAVHLLQEISSSTSSLSPRLLDVMVEASKLELQQRSVTFLALFSCA